MAVTKNLGRVTFVNRGAYSESVTYNRLDLVIYGGGTWCALQTVKGVSPVSGAYWMVIAERGDKGETGATGDNITVDSVTPSNKNVTLDALKYTPMTLTSAQKAETRSNINAQEKLVIDTELSSVSENIVENSAITEAADEISEKLEDGKADAAWDDVQSVDIVSISDGADDVPVRALSVGVEPIQDLHGYDSPWPGGGGKNLYKDTFDGWTQPVNYWIYPVSLPEGTYKLSATLRTGKTAVTGTAVGFAKSGTQYTDFDTLVLALNTGGTIIAASPVTITSGDAPVLAFYGTEESFYAVMDAYEVQLEAGNTATSYVPYSNICPISGRTGLTAYRTGKNLLTSISQTQTINDVTWTLNSDGSVKIFGTATANSVYDFGRDVVTLPAGTYTTFDESTGGGYSVTVFKVVNGVASPIKNGGGEFTLSDETSVFVRYLVANGNTVNTTIFPQIELGSTVTPYEPYVGTTLPISFPLMGANQWDEEWEVGGFNYTTGAPLDDADRIRAKNFCGCVPSTQYYWVVPNKNLRILFYDEDENFISFEGWYDSSRIITTPSNAAFFKIAGSAAYGTTYNNDIAINYPSSVTTYNAYDPTNHTVYGATLDPITGVLTVTHGIVTLSKNDTINVYGYRGTNGIVHAYILENGCNRQEGISSHSTLKSGASTDSQYMWAGVNQNQSVYWIGILDVLGLTTLDQYKTWLDGQTVQVVYELPTPQTYQLTPEDVRTLLGVNNVWANCGPIVNFEYVADTKLYIDGKFAALLAIASES